MVNLVGELGINHCGDEEKALEIVNAFSFLEAIKIQKMTPSDFVRPQLQDKPHANPANSFGKTYLEHRENLELSIEFYRELKKVIKKNGQLFGASVCDVLSAKQIIDLKPDYIKIPSCLCNNFELLAFIGSHWKGALHISLGMTDYRERFAVQDRIKHATYYTCTSCYEEKGDVYLGGQAVSIHQPNIIYAQAAIMNGARWVEYHITTDRKMKGSDQPISLLPAEYKKLQRWVKAYGKQIDRIRWKRPREVPAHEKMARSKLWNPRKVSYMP